MRPGCDLPLEGCQGERKAPRRRAMLRALIAAVALCFVLVFAFSPLFQRRLELQRGSLLYCVDDESSYEFVLSGEYLIAVASHVGFEQMGCVILKIHGRAGVSEYPVFGTRDSSISWRVRAEAGERLTTEYWVAREGPTLARHGPCPEGAEFDSAVWLQPDLSWRLEVVVRTA